MGNLSNIPNLRVEDFPGQKEWIGKLFIQLNSFIQSVSQTINGQIQFPDNMKSVSQIYSISAFQEFSFLWPFKDATPNDVRITKATKGTTQTPTILMAAWAYDNSTQSITISRISEVNLATVSELSGSYQFTIRATV